MVEQDLQVTFNPNGCFVGDMNNQGKLIAKEERNGRKFTLDVNMPEVNSMLFTHGKGARDIGIWHKRVGHVNLQRLKLMEKYNLVGGCRTPNSLKDSNVSPSRRQRKREESGHAP